MVTRVRFGPPVPARDDDCELRSVDWLDKYSPVNVAELAMNKTKARELETALTKGGVVIVSGPSGSAKSTAVRLIAEMILKKQVVEFPAPPDGSIGDTSVMRSLEDFLLGAAMFPASRVLVLLDELPNFFHEETRQRLEDSLLDWAEASANSNVGSVHHPTLVVTFTEIETSSKYGEAAVVPRIFGQLLLHPQCSWIKTNPIAPTMMSKILRRIIESEHIQVSPKALQELTSGGDIRSALRVLELEFRTSVTGCNNRRAGVWGQRESPIRLFHAINKIVYGSVNPPPITEVLEDFTDSIETFNLTVLDNYERSKNQRLPITSAVHISEWLSLGDLGFCRITDLSIVPAIGVWNEIHDLGEEDLVSGSGAFKQAQFTQNTKWKAEYHKSYAQTLNYMRNRRHFGPLTLTTSLEERSYRISVQTTTIFSDDDDDDDDDDD